ncbi:hypothetical protein EDC01DRAFT_785816 [Geopyxis carbonaria]|nr:hypothetical protein EDC01DRAFT_785816 [Geopyxis carbonaria]
MHPPRLLAALTTLFAAAHAALDILIPEYYTLNITANSAFPITLRDRSAAGGPVRVYLALTPPGGGTNTVCVLAPSVATTAGTERTPLNVTIPANIGSEGRYYSIGAARLKGGRGQGYYYSTRFSVAGMTGNFTEFETEWSVGDSESLACAGYECARGCALRWVQPVLMGEKEATSKEKESAWAKEKTCIQEECPNAVAGAAAAKVGGGGWRVWVAAGVVAVGAMAV